MEEGRPKFGSWLNILLFAVTCASAFFVGLSWSVSYIFSDQLAAAAEFAPPAQAFSDPRVIGLSLVYALVLIIILLGHEMGHYLTCRHYRIEATLPFFIPAPTLIGTLGAFIRIKSPISLKKHLFDIGIAGPLTGFILSLPAIVYGLSLSKVLPAVPRDQALVFGEPLLLKFISGILFKNAPAGSDLFLHPVGFAGWVGMLVTAFNLFPFCTSNGNAKPVFPRKSIYHRRLAFPPKSSAVSDNFVLVTSPTHLLVLTMSHDESVRGYNAFASQAARKATRPRSRPPV
jgi:hypothetical protein